MRDGTERDDHGYMSVKEAILELQHATMQARSRVPSTLRLAPIRSPERLTYTQQIPSPSSAPGCNPVDDASRTGADLGLWNRASISSVPSSSPTSQKKFLAGALGGSAKSGLNQPATYHYGESPLKPILCYGNQYCGVGSNSMFGSQVSR